MTFPRVLSDWLMADPSLRRSPVAPVDSALSLWNLMGSTNKRQCDMLVTHNNIIILKYHEQVHVHVIKRNLIQVHSPTTPAQFQNKPIWFYTSNTFITLKLIFLKCMITQISHNSSIFLQLTSTAQTTFKHIILKILAKASRLYSNVYKDHNLHTGFSVKLSTLKSFLWPLTTGNPWPLNLSLTFDSPSCQINKVHHRRPCHALSGFIRGLLDKCDGNNGMSSTINEG